MAKRDPNKSARNRIIIKIKNELRDLLPTVLQETGVETEASLNAKIGSKTDDFFDLKNEIIHSDNEFIIKWLSGLKQAIESGAGPAYEWIDEQSKSSANFKKYLLLFLKRSYLKHFDELSKNRPHENDSVIWIGQKNAHYGLLVTPRFRNGEWENDRSEIRAFEQGYWTIGHVLTTGLVIPGQNEKVIFDDVEQYLSFFRNVLVRNSGSKYEYEISGYYNEFVRSSANPLSIPLMIPEFRYRGLEKQHKYRLDFMITNPFTLSRVGFELSPWSTHGYLHKIKGLTQKEINEMAADNFSKEMSKHRAYFNKHRVYTLIYTDDELKDCKKIFNDDISPHLNPEKLGTQLSFTIMEEFL
ncbi:TPA: topoisomerase [Enterobacter hormaechei]|uniref:topoisomerase n=1 Tax=Enterobacter cloacae complex TaxID=354276 RepID=UPI003BD79B6E|nr:topoisomerase [Enterobacter hormaechei]MCE1509752.1 topoisomerase [Enterobacter hormaechei]HCR0211448.1 topoisomerase [Enterobacter hormaechei]